MVSRICTLLYSVPKFDLFISKFFTLLQLRVKNLFYGRSWTVIFAPFVLNEAIETLPHILIECEPVCILERVDILAIIKVWQLSSAYSLRDYNRFPKC